MAPAPRTPSCTPPGSGVGRGQRNEERSECGRNEVYLQVLRCAPCPRAGVCGQTCCISPADGEIWNRCVCACACVRALVCVCVLAGVGAAASGGGGAGVAPL